MHHTIEHDRAIGQTKGHPSLAAIASPSKIRDCGHFLPQVTTKAPDVCRAVEGVADRLTNDAVVVVLCNGMGAYDELISRPRLSDVSFLLAATSLGAFTTKRCANDDKRWSNSVENMR